MTETRQYQPGGTVTYQGRQYRVHRQQGGYVGLIDPTRIPIIDDENGQQVAHFAVMTADVTQEAGS